MDNPDSPGQNVVSSTTDFPPSTSFQSAAGSQSAAGFQSAAEALPSGSAEGSIRPYVFAWKFDPAEFGLREDFHLTDYADSTRETGRVLPQVVVDYLFQDDPESELRHTQSTVTQTRHEGLLLVQALELFHPIVENPYAMGKIACNGVLSESFARGPSECDNVLMFLTPSDKMSEYERDVILPLMIQGFKDSATEAGCSVTGGQTIMNPWLCIGGVATTVCPEEYVIPRDAAVPGDVLVLTKPLGLDIALTGRARLIDPEFSKRVRVHVLATEADLDLALERAIDTMARSNMIAAKLMRPHRAHCAVAIGELGLLGHAQLMVERQLTAVNFVIHNLPVIAKMTAIDRICSREFRLHQGLSRETGGGLLVSIPRTEAPAYCKELERESGYPAWIVGIVEAGIRQASVITRARVIEVPANDTEGQLW